MSKAFLYLGALAFLAFVVSRQFAAPSTWEPFVQGCVKSGATQAQCECLADYVHERLDEAEVRAVMSNQVTDSELQRTVNAVVRAGTQVCE